MGLMLTAVAAGAQDKKDALAGTWAREAGGFDLKVEFREKDTVKITAVSGENGAAVTAKYTVGKDGRVKAKITEVKEIGKFAGAPPVGLEFSFTWKVKGDTATLDDVVGKDLEHAKPILEGDYKAAKKK